MKITFEVTTRYELNMPDSADKSEVIKAVAQFAENDDSRDLDNLYIFHNMKIADRQLEWVTTGDKSHSEGTSPSKPGLDTFFNNLKDNGGVL